MSVASRRRGRLRRRRRRESGVGDTQEIFEQKQVPGVGIGEPAAHLRPGLRGIIEMVDSHAGAKQSRDDAERDVAGVGFAVRGYDCGCPLTRRERSRLAGQPALADPRRPDEVDDATGAADRLVDEAR